MLVYSYPKHKTFDQFEEYSHSSVHVYHPCPCHFSDKVPHEKNIIMRNFVANNRTETVLKTTLVLEHSREDMLKGINACHV